MGSPFAGLAGAQSERADLARIKCTLRGASSQHQTFLSPLRDWLERKFYFSPAGKKARLGENISDFLLWFAARDDAKIRWWREKEPAIFAPGDWGLIFRMTPSALTTPLLAISLSPAFSISLLLLYERERRLKGNERCCPIILSKWISCLCIGATCWQFLPLCLQRIRNKCTRQINSKARLPARGIQRISFRVRRRRRFLLMSEWISLLGPLRRGESFLLVLRNEVTWKRRHKSKLNGRNLKVAFEEARDEKRFFLVSKNQGQQNIEIKVLGIIW